jgi:hypothetical protein
MKVICLHETKTVNTGDLKCLPKLYYDIPSCDVGDIRRFQDFDNYDMIIVGGGGLIDLDYFDGFLERIGTLEDKLKVIWGAGLNGYRYTYPGYIANYDLIGLRDSIFKNLKMDKFKYVPCVSCKNTLFDEPVLTETTDVLYYYHHFETMTNKMNELVSRNPHITNFEVAKNSDDMASIIEKMSRAKVIVTNTYHGTYWGSLLGKKIYTVETTTKSKLLDLPLNIEFIKYDTIINIGNTKNDYELSYLKECRQLNDNFYNGVKNMINNYGE